MRLPNGFGSVAKLSGRRRRPYIVKKTVGWNEKGHPIILIIGYATTREEGLRLLAAYNHDPWDVNMAKLNLQELFDLWLEKKAPKLGESNRIALCSAYRYCQRFGRLPYRSLRAYQMQECIDHCGRGYSTQAAIKNLWRHLDRFALELDILNRSYSVLLTSEPAPPTTRNRFSDAEIDQLWENCAHPFVDVVLILTYSGWRIGELLNMKTTDVDLHERTMRGGNKTKAGKNRVVPIHSLIFPLVQRRMKEGGEYLVGWQGGRLSTTQFRTQWKAAMGSLKISKTPHECRHTFESLLDSAGANRKCIDMMMGHVSKDTGNRIYNHKTVDELRRNLELVTRN